jgi:hypothetical protein
VIARAPDDAPAAHLTSRHRHRQHTLGDHIGYLRHDGTPEYLFDPFQPDHDRDADRGFRR